MFLSESPVRSPSPDFPVSSEPSGKKDLFGNEDLFGSDLPNTGAKSVIGRSSNTNIEKSSPDEDIFSGKSIGFPKAKVDNLDDLFSSANSDSKTKTVPDTSLDDDDDDLFAFSSKKSTTTERKVDPVIEKSNTSSEEVKTSKPAMVDDDDDIFAVKKSKPKPKPSPIIEDDDDDLFSSSSLNKPKSKDSGAKATNGLPEDDIFADSSSSKKKGNRIPK